MTRTALLCLMILVLVALAGCVSTSNGWPKRGQRAFMKDCTSHTSADISPAMAQAYCTCMLGKIMTQYANMNEAADKLLGTVMGEIQMEKLAEDCVEEMGRPTQ